jgi:hypothetical protein
MLDTDRGSSTTGQTWGRRLQDCNGADALVGGQFPDKFSTEGGTVSKTACIAEGVYRRND